MPVIKPISDLRNYNQVLEKVSVGSPVYLTKNGHGCYTIMDINEQEEMYEHNRLLLSFTDLPTVRSTLEILFSKY